MRKALGAFVSLAFVAVAAVALGVALGSAASLTGAPPVAASSPASTGVARGRSARRAPDFAVRTVYGRAFRLSAQRGKVVVLDFLVPGCLECEIGAPSLAKAARLFGARGLKVLILDVSQIGDKQLRGYYYGRLRVGQVMVAADRGFTVARKYGVKALGTTVIVGRDGTIKWQGTWLGDERKLFDAIRRALG